MKSIEVEKLTKQFGSFIAVDRISFNIDKAEIFGFLGPNGAGKTTTIRMLCGILKPTSGKGSVAGFDIVRENEKIKQHIGYMSQRFSLYPDLTVAENLEFFAGIYRVESAKKNERMKRAIATAALEEYTQHLVRELPGGFKQRLALVCALIHAPAIVFLDEPTAGVDPISRRNFWNLIYRLKNEEQTTVFVTTHYMDEAEHCERIALIQNGKIAALGSPAALKENMMSSIFVVQGSPFLFMKKVAERNDHISQVIPFGLSLHCLFNDENYVLEFRQQLLNAGIQLVRLEKIQPSLEDVFITLAEK